MHDTTTAPRRKGFLDAVERFGNALPDPVFLFLGIIVVLVAVSIVGANAGWMAVNPVTGELLAAKSLLTEDNVEKLFVEMPRTYSSFTPLGIALTIMLGASVADRAGLLSAMMRGSLARVSAPILTPVVFVIGMLTVHAFDAGYVVYVPLAGLAFAAAGRHPILGIIAGYSGAAVGLSGNLFPGQYDMLLLGLTETGVRLIDPNWVLNPLGNWWFSVAIAVAFTAIAWPLIDRVMAPRLGAWNNAGAEQDFADARLTPVERRGLAAAGLAALLVSAGVAALTLWPGAAPFRDEAATGTLAYAPFFRALIPCLFILFVVTGWAYGARVGTIKSHRDVVTMMVDGLVPFLPYVVLVFFAAHFVAMFSWSNLGPITAIKGAEALRSLNAPPALLLPLLTTMSAWLDFLIASGSAKWAAMSPVATPMLMLLGISPEMTTAAYRVGDTVTNLISPLNPYFVLTFTFCQRWVPEFRLGALLAMMLPLAGLFYLAGIVITSSWVAFDLPVGPGAQVTYQLPVQN